MVSFFIQRPIFASAIAAILVLAGAICYFLLPVSQFPEITPPQIVVSANYPGAGAQVVADTVTTPLEEQINGVEGMTYMSSSSSNDGSSTITVTFNVGYPLDIAAVDVQNRVSQAASSLPAIVNQGGVTIKKQNPNFVLIVNLTSPDHSVDQVALSNYAYLQIVDQLKRLPGVGDVRIFGERRYSMRVWLDPDKLANLGVTAIDVQNAIAEQNVQVAAGKIGASPAPAGTPFELQVNAAGRLSNPDEFSNIIVRADPASGAAIRLRDVARVELGALQYSSSAYFGKDPTVVLGVFQMPGSNALDLQRRVTEKMDELSTRFPHGIAYAMHYDTTRFVSAAMRDVVVTLLEALALVIFVVFVFLQNWRATIIPTIAIPVSLIATLAVMEVLGFSLNMLSLLGMVLAIGLVVDDAIVVVENVERQLEAGLPPLAAAKKAMSEVTGPIIATTAVLMAVFVPVAFIPGVAGRLYNQFALTVAISVGISAFNSLTLSPALSAAMLRHSPKGSSFVFRWFNAGFDWLSHAYSRSVRQFVRFGWALVGVFALLVAGAYGLSRAVPTTFLPVEDQGYFFVVVQAPDGASLERTDAVARHVRDILEFDSRRRDRRLHQRAQFPHQRGAVEFGGRIRDPEALGPARPGRERLEPRRPGAAEAARHSRRLRAELRSALGQRPRRDRRLRVRGRGFRRRRQRRPQRRDAGPDRRRAPAAGAQSAIAVHLVFGLDPAAPLRSRPVEGEAARPRPARHLQHPADRSRLALRQRLQSVQPHVPGDPAGRQGRARERPPTSTSCSCAMRPAAWFR